VSVAAKPGKRAALCAACHVKRCCFHYTVAATGRDVWRILRALQIPARDFLACRAVDEATPAAFELQANGARYLMVLSRHELPQPLASPCVFLVRTNDEKALCGLGELRPGPCQTYPVMLKGDVIALVNDPQGCVRTWSYRDIDMDERRRIRRVLAEEEEYRALVQEWNAELRQQGGERSFDEFLSYLVNRYAATEAAAA
jgi:Fe-S-cluster containining protein